MLNIAGGNLSSKPRGMIWMRITVNQLSPTLICKRCGNIANCMQKFFQTSLFYKSIQMEWSCRTCSIWWGRHWHLKHWYHPAKVTFPNWKCIWLNRKQYFTTLKHLFVPHDEWMADIGTYLKHWHNPAHVIRCIFPTCEMYICLNSKPKLSTNFFLCTETLLLTMLVQFLPMKVQPQLLKSTSWLLWMEYTIIKGIIMSRKPQPASPILNIVNVFTGTSWVIINYQRHRQKVLLKFHVLGVN